MERIFLKESLKNIPKLKAAAIVSYEGIPIASMLPEGVNDSEIAALTATLLSLAERAILCMHTEGLEQICIQGTDQYFIIFTAGQNAVLTISASKDANLGLIFLEGKRCCKKITLII